MAEVEVKLVKAFTKDPGQGNPAGVVHNADSLSDSQMQEIAKTLGFSESAFVLKSDTANFRVRFFAIKQEVDFCGHATIATFHFLMEKRTINLSDKQSVIVTQETKAGVLPVTCFADGKIMMTQGSPEFGEIEKDRLLIANLMGIKEEDLGETPIQTVSTVIPKIIIPIKSLEVLRKIKPNLEDISQYCQEYSGKGFYLFTTETLDSDSDFATRYFNPLVGINEDPATGVAAGPLACYTDKHIFHGSKKQFVIEQGFDMGADSKIYVDITNDVMVGGYAVTYGGKKVNV